ncbi:MAG: AAA family ATPase [SAR202 cluster bacterium]|nr:AAA family ATPase [SAR202 cluster bacterium]
MKQPSGADLEVIIERLPPSVATILRDRGNRDGLLEVILDLGRKPEARYIDETVILSDREVSDDDILYVTKRISPFGGDNRAGIERSLHRISAIHNRTGKVIGLTIRIGRAVFGTIRVIEDLVLSGQSILLLGKPGVGKTTMLREVSRVIADDAQKRVVIVDTSNEIAGDGDIPHPGIGGARRMQVTSPDQQHRVMIEAVENHMPEVIIIDEIGTELEANAARTIAERGVQLVATAHGNTLENLVQNPTLSDLVGGIQAVTLGDIEARRRRTQKTVLERKAPPTFDALVEIQGWSRVAIHSDLTEAVDRMLRGYGVTLEERFLGANGEVQNTQVGRAPEVVAQERGGIRRREYHSVQTRQTTSKPPEPTTIEETTEDHLTQGQPSPRTIKVMPYGVNKGKVQQAIGAADLAVSLTDNLEEAELVLTTKSFYRRRTNALRQAEEAGRPVYVLRKNTTSQMHQFLTAITRKNNAHERNQDRIEEAVKEAELAAKKVDDSGQHSELTPQTSYIRHLQHQVAEEHGLKSTSSGSEPRRRVVMYRE